MAAWVRDTAPARDALARLDFQSVLVSCRSAARITRRQLGERAGLPASVLSDPAASQAAPRKRGAGRD